MEPQPRDYIIKSIKDRVSTSFDQWAIGITSDPDPHRETHKFRGSWRIWQTQKPDDGIAIEKYFLDRGMKSDAERSPEGARYVYIY